MRLLDLFCGAGGAAMGYHRAGFDEIVGVDINPQPNYPFEFIRANALERSDFGGFDLVHASPPCQSYSALKGLIGEIRPALVEPVRDLLAASGVPHVIENVVGAPLVDPIRLCGSSFGLGVWRHRLFELSFPVALVPPCSHYHHPKPVDVTGTGGPSSKPRTDGGGVSRKPRSLEHARQSMGVDWMTRRELSEAIPPAYTEWIGTQFLNLLT